MNAKAVIENHQLADGSEDNLSQRAKGDFYPSENGFRFEYEENENELGGITTLLVDGQTALVKRTGGKFRSEMHFKLNEKCECIYSTPYGNISLETKANEIFYAVEKRRAMLKIGYSLYQSGVLQSENKILIKISFSEETDV